MCQHIVAVHLVAVVVIVATIDYLSSVFYQMKVLDGSYVMEKTCGSLTACD